MALGLGGGYADVYLELSVPQFSALGPVLNLYGGRSLAAHITSLSSAPPELTECSPAEGTTITNAFYLQPLNTVNTVSRSNNAVSS